ncbi:hypothetical protein JZ751_008707, partial [Albula glossodonta]
EVTYWSNQFNHVTCGEEMQFSTPENIEDHCIRDALDCFRKELAVVRHQCRDQHGKNKISAFEEVLEELLKAMPLNTAAQSEKCSSCEFYQERPFQTFKDKLILMLQRAVNSMYRR